jgi:hypothetical protein
MTWRATSAGPWEEERLYGEADVREWLGSGAELYEGLSDRSVGDVLATAEGIIAAVERAVRTTALHFSSFYALAAQL